jgi:hypothetical protein
MPQQTQHIPTLIRRHTDTQTTHSQTIQITSNSTQTDAHTHRHSQKQTQATSTPRQTNSTHMYTHTHTFRVHFTFVVAVAIAQPSLCLSLQRRCADDRCEPIRQVGAEGGWGLGGSEKERERKSIIEAREGFDEKMSGNMVKTRSRFNNIRLLVVWCKHIDLISSNLLPLSSPLITTPHITIFLL